MILKQLTLKPPAMENKTIQLATTPEGKIVTIEFTQRGFTLCLMDDPKNGKIIGTGSWERFQESTIKEAIKAVAQTHTQPNTD
jgi:hypothetical protein